MSFAIVNGQHLFGNAAMQHQMNMTNNTQYKMNFQNQCLHQPFLNQDLTPEPFKNQTFRNEFDLNQQVFGLIKSDPLPFIKDDPIPLIKHDHFSTNDFGIIKSDPTFFKKDTFDDFNSWKNQF